MRSIPVFYSDHLVADSRSFSPSAAKPKAVVEDWLAHGLPIEIMKPKPADAELLSLAHDAQYVRGVLAGRIDNGFGNRIPEVAATLPWTSGAMLSAALAVLRKRGPWCRVACAPVSGFHHAGYSHGHGYCTFNGLMVAALALKKHGLVRQVGILDFDFHYGDGTENILNTLGIEWVNHYSAGIEFRYPRQAEQFDAYRLTRLATDCAPADYNYDGDDRQTKVDLLLYQAGADAHVDDPLGGFLTTDQMYERDRMVFKTCATFEIPLVWCLAGGYQRDAAGTIAPVLELHRNTMQACVEVYR